MGTVLAFASGTDPNQIYTHQTWERFAEGKTLVGVNEDETEFNTVGKTGGEKSHTLKIAEIPSHGNHTYSSLTHAGAKSRYLGDAGTSTYGTAGRGWIAVSGGEYYPAGQSLGGSGSHNNLQPYETVYYWKRTA